MTDEKLIQGLIESVSEVLKDMEKMEVDLYWSGQLTAHLDSHDISVFDLINNKKLVVFERN